MCSEISEFLIGRTDMGEVIVVVLWEKEEGERERVREREEGREKEREWEREVREGRKRERNTFIDIFVKNFINTYLFFIQNYKDWFKETINKQIIYKI